MVFFNYATMQMAAKIVYYGPGLCGKTTNLHYIYAKTSPQSRGEMVSLETETDRTLFFDLLPIDVGVIGGFKTRLQLYTIPGQVFYNTTRKLVLKGVDGLVFVADSQSAMMEANLESFKNLKENLAEIGLNIGEIPLVLQFNKRDLPSIADVDTLRAALDPDARYDFMESVAATGVGVFETLKLISKLTLRTLRRRMTGDEPAKTVPRRGGDVAALHIKDPMTAGRGGSATAIGTIQPAQRATSAAAASMPVREEIDEIEESGEEIATKHAFSDSTLAKTADIDSRIISDAPVAEARSAAAPVAAPPTTPEPEIEIPQTEKPSKRAPDVKHVKVRSSVDIMAELEALRKRATQTTSKPHKKEAAQSAAAQQPRRQIEKSVSLHVPAGVLPKTKALKLTVSFEGSDGVVQSQEQSVELGDTSDAKSISVNLKIES